jgi:hypothetical protein
MIPVGVEMYGGSEFDIYKIPQNQEKLYIDAKIRKNQLLMIKSLVNYNIAKSSLQYTIRLP